MHLVLTDVLTCPKCGPSTGLIVLADRMADRRVLDGRLGCPICETKYPVVAGVADLRLRGEPAAETAPSYTGDPPRLAALMGIIEPRGFSLVMGPAGGRAAEIAGAIPNLELVVMSGAPVTEAGVGVSPVLIDGGLPLQGSSMRSVIVTGSPTAAELVECARVASGGAHVVIDADRLDVDALVAAGLKVLVAEGNTAVAVRAL